MAGPRIVYNRLLGGWYVVTGPHQVPLGGRFESKEAAQRSLKAREYRGARGAPGRAQWGNRRPAGSSSRTGRWMFT